MSMSTSTSIHLDTDPEQDAHTMNEQLATLHSTINGADIVPHGTPYLKTAAPIDHEALQDHMTEILIGLGLDTDDPSIKDTPARVIKMLASFCQPFDPQALLVRGFQSADTASVWYGGADRQSSTAPAHSSPHDPAPETIVVFSWFRGFAGVAHRDI